MIAVGVFDRMRVWPSKGLAGEVRFELTHNGFRDRRATDTLLPNMEIF